LVGDSISNIQYPISNIQYPISNIQSPITNHRHIACPALKFPQGTDALVEVSDECAGSRGPTNWIKRV